MMQAGDIGMKAPGLEIYDDRWRKSWPKVGVIFSGEISILQDTSF